jgi:hypothetical protein
MTAVFESPAVRIAVTRVTTTMTVKPSLLKSLLSRGVGALGNALDGKGAADLILGFYAERVCRKDGY